MEGQVGSPGRKRRYFARKSVAMLQYEAANHGLKRTLSATNLVFLGIGCILGAGIYVMTGTAAANYAGPAVVLSFIIAGFACGLTALCYAELASAMPVTGSAYSYCYAAIGEVAAWAIGWLLLFEYGLAAAALAVGFSGYLTSLLADFSLHIPAVFATPMIEAVVTPVGTEFIQSNSFNLVAALAITLVTIVLTLGVNESARVNNVMVVIKIAVLLAFVAVGVTAVDPANWVPFIPENQGSFAYGWPGVVRAASILFFAYIGFESVSTAAAEARNPQRDMPIGILGSLLVCTVVYIAVAFVLTGIVSYRRLGVADPIAVAVNALNMPSFAILIKIGALMGLASVLLVNAYGQSRVGFAMGRDGLLPPMFCRIHKTFQTPHLATIFFGVLSAVAAALLPITIVADLASLGAGFGFATVAFSLMWLRSTRPDIERPFRVPFGGFWIGKAWIGYVPTLAIILCLAMITPVLIDIGLHAMRGNVIPAVIILVYAVSGVVFYMVYGSKNAISSKESFD